MSSLWYKSAQHFSLILSDISITHTLSLSLCLCIYLYLSLSLSLSLHCFLTFIITSNTAIFWVASSHTKQECSDNLMYAYKNKWNHFYWWYFFKKTMKVNTTLRNRVKVCYILLTGNLQTLLCFVMFINLRCNYLNRITKKERNNQVTVVIHSVF